jgi:hypothetical protein
LCDAVKDGIRQFLIEHENVLPRAVVRLAHQGKKLGFPMAAVMLYEEKRKAGIRPTREDGLYEEEHLLLTVPEEYVFSKLPPQIRESYLPFAAFEIVAGRPGPRQMLLRMRSLHRQKTAGGTAYYSRRPRMIHVRGQERIAAFYRHAVDRVRERITGNLRSYVGLTGVFSILDGGLLFEVWCPSPDTQGFSMFAEMGDDRAAGDTIGEILGSYDRSKRYYWRVGYCPAVMTDRLLVAKTLLLPGMQGTPEFDQSVRRWPRDRRVQFQKEVARLTSYGEGRWGDDVTKAFHDGGTPQILCRGEGAACRMGIRLEVCCSGPLATEPAP